MGFQLVIATGQEAGREFVFDQGSVVIGRTAECDIVLYDAGVSRRHARIVEEPQGLFIEDLGSSNGTKVNGVAIEKRSELSTGDSISLGSVTFSFSQVSTDTVALSLDAPEPPTDPELDEHTRVLELSERKRTRNRGVAALPKDVPRAELEQRRRASTSVQPAYRPGQTSLKRAEPHSTLDDETASKTTPTALAPSDKARIRRAHPLVGSAIIFWHQANTRERRLVTTGSVVFFAACTALIAFALWPSSGDAKPVEPTTLTAEPMAFSFGLGPGVTFEHPNDVSFDFEPHAPVRVLVIIHCQSKDLSPNEVSVSVNGVALTVLEPDSAGAEQEVLVPAALIHNNAVNLVTFDNLKNPPGHEAWRISAVWAEVAVLPELEPVALKREALERYYEAEGKLKLQGVGASNLWNAYRGFRESWLALNSLPTEHQDGISLELARSKMVNARHQLDHVCSTLLLEAKQQFELKQFDQARASLDHVVDYFPVRSGHPCQAQAEAARGEYEL